MSKRCEYCGRYFTPDRRVGNRQRCCGSVECKGKRKQSSQKSWVQKNPGYFYGRYDYVKEWRTKRRQADDIEIAKNVIQDKIPHANPIQQLTLLIPERLTGVIQDEIRLRRVGNSTFAAYG